MNARVMKMPSKRIFITCAPPSINTPRTRTWRHNILQIWFPQVIFTRSPKILLPIPPAPGLKYGKIPYKVSTKAIRESLTSTAALRKSRATALAMTAGKSDLLSTSSAPAPAIETPWMPPDAATRTPNYGRRDKYAPRAARASPSKVYPVDVSRH